MLNNRFKVGTIVFFCACFFIFGAILNEIFGKNVIWVYFILLTLSQGIMWSEYIPTEGK